MVGKKASRKPGTAKAEGQTMRLNIVLQVYIKAKILYLSYNIIININYININYVLYYILY